MTLPKHRWSIKDSRQSTNILHSLLAKRKLDSDFLDPELMILPPVGEVFVDLDKATAILEQNIRLRQSIGISGDYDVDGMTSTALLLRVFRTCGGNAIHAIPSRTNEGYGINERIIEEFHEQGITTIVTVDNGTSAVKPINLAVELGMFVIVTDHHEPSATEPLPMATAILNPKFVDQTNVWSQVSGVGMAFILGMCVAHRFGKDEELMPECLELLTLGTIADMVPLSGVNRRWVKRGLTLIPNSSNLGIQALIAAAGLDTDGKTLSPEDVGFKLAPRINSVGRIGEPSLIIDLFSTDDPMRAMEVAHEIEELNKKRQEMTKEAKTKADYWLAQLKETYERENLNLAKKKVILMALGGVHKGIVGLIANYVVEKTGLPAFVAAFSEDSDILYGSCRGGSSFNVKEALDYCAKFLKTGGGHKAAGGFSLTRDNFTMFHHKLDEYANANLRDEDIGKLIIIDQELALTQVNAQTYESIQHLQPFGMGNPEPIFCTKRVKVVKQEPMNFPGAVKLEFEQAGVKVKATAWDFAQYLPLPEYVDVAYKLKNNVWKGRSTIELNLESVKEV